MSLATSAEIVFWTSLLGLVYTYAGYPLLVTVVSWLSTREVEGAEITPSVTLIITAYNEERDLRAKLENALALDYPADQLEILVVSDGSTDSTDEIAQEFSDRGVCLLRQPERRGKTAAQNAAVLQARGEILLFSDATTRYEAGVVRRIVRKFADPTIGCVAGRLAYQDPVGSAIGCGARCYWAYESFLKRCESRAGSLIGASGCLYAVRRSAYQPLPHEACSDFVIATRMVEQGLRAVYEPTALCWEMTHRQASRELRMRVRIITQTLADLWRHRRMLNPLRSGFYAVQLFSHKVLRYVVPFFLAPLLVTSAFLAPRSEFYSTMLLAQAGVYTLALIPWMFEGRIPRVRFLALPHYFLLANVAVVIALCHFLRGERYARWEPIREITGNRTAINPGMSTRERGQV